MSQPSLLETISTQLDASQALPELRDALFHVAQADIRYVEEGKLWAWLIPAIQAMLGDMENRARPFAAAWSLMNAATGRLDDVQDNDPTDDSLPFHQPAVQYHLVLSYYVLATSLLDDLASTGISPQRIAVLRRLWSQLVLRAASGQLRDLIASDDPTLQGDALTYYQQLAQAKSGSIFALAFGGTAALVSDDANLVQLFVSIGEIFGTLVQYGDDLLDSAQQPNATLTLPNAYARAVGHQPVGQQPTQGQNYWSHLRQHYIAHVDALVVQAYPTLVEPIHAIFVRAFRAP